MEKRVVITGRGAITPIGNTIGESWEGIKAGKCGIGKITSFDVEPHKVKMGAEIEGFAYEDKKAARRLDRSSQLALTAAKEAVANSGIVSGENVNPDRFGVIGGTGVGGIATLEAEVTKGVKKDNLTRGSAFLVPMVMPNAIAGNLAIENNAKGTCIGVVSACSAGTHSVGEAFRNIKHGYSDVILAGASESVFTPVCFSGFANMTAMSTRVDPLRCSTPFDVERDGFVLGEGAAFLVLEELEHAKARGAKIYGEVVGYGATCDAYHITQPEPSGEGAGKAMQLAIDEAGIKPADIDYINAHGTSTPYNDLFETNAVKAVFGEDTKVPMSSTKSMTGHLLGAAGSMEAAFCVEALNDGFIPATIGLEKPDPELTLDYVPNKGRDAELNYVLTNSLGFGGHNGTLVLKKYNG